MLFAHFHSGLALLLQSHDYSLDVRRDIWDFAIEFQTLRATGLSNSDLRWLLCKGYVRHAAEAREDGTEGRSFVPLRGLALNERCCFVLTAAGVEFARRVSGADGLVSCGARLSGVGGEGASGPCEPNGRPHWEKDRRMLHFRQQVVKQFKLPAQNQEIILAAFEEEGWPLRIDDPLPSAPSIDPKRRLHDTINSLNRNQRSVLLRFFGDGSGEAICWEPAEALTASAGRPCSSATA